VGEAGGSFISGENREGKQKSRDVAALTTLLTLTHDCLSGIVRTPQRRTCLSHYLHQIAYSCEGWQTLIAQPQNRVEMVRQAIEKLGGKIVSAWFAFGDYDVVIVTEMPDDVSAAGLAIALAGGGACKSVHTTPLLSPEEALQAMKKAGESGYRAARTA
jgi:uncharacterized protein with GYD domain